MVSSRLNQLRRRLLAPAVAALLLLWLAPASSAFAALGVSVTVANGQPTSIDPGRTTQLMITLSNSNAAAAVNAVTFANNLPGTLPNGLKVAGAATYTCTDPAGPTTTPGAGTFTAAIGTQAISLSGGVIPARSLGNNTDGSCTIIIPVTAGTSSGNSATYAYDIASGAVTGNDGTAVANVGAVGQSINVNSLAQPTIVKNFGNANLVLGGASTPLTITVANSNTVDIAGFAFTDNFPQFGGSAIIKVANPSGATGNCTSGPAPSFTAGAGFTAISAGGTIPAGGSCTFTVNVEAAQTGGEYTTGARVNRIGRNTDFTTSLGIPAAADATANITATSPLRVAKAFDKPALSSGATGSLTITLSNDGASQLNVATFDDSPIDGVGGGVAGTGLTINSSSTSCVGGSTAQIASNKGVRLTGGAIPAGGSCEVTVNFTGNVQSVRAPVSYTNVIAKGAVDVGDSGIVNNSVSASILVADDLRVRKFSEPAQVAPGNPVKYRVVVENYGGGPVANVAVNDTFSDGQTYLTGTINGVNYTPGLSAACGVVSVAGATGSPGPVFTIPTVPARADVNTPGACELTFWAMASASPVANAKNTIPIGGVCYNGATCNNVASDVTDVEADRGVLGVSKAFAAPGTFAEGTITRLTITLSNMSANPLTNVTISDSLQVAQAGGGQLRIANPANAASTCGAPTITATPGDSSITINNGSVPPRANQGLGAAGTCVVQVDVVGPAGVYNNTATVDATETLGNGTTRSVGQSNSNVATLTYTSALGASKSFNPASVSSGGVSTVTVQLQNSSALALTGVRVTDPLPAGMTIATPPNAYTTCAGSTAVTAVAGASSATLTGAAIAGNGNCAFRFDVVATGSANWINAIPPNNILADGGVRNVTAVQATLNFNSPTNMTVAKASNPSTLTFPGQVSRLTITITNGTQPVSDLRVTDYFTTDGTPNTTPNGWVIAPAPNAATDCPGGVVSATASATSVSLAGVSLAASAVCTVSVNVTSNSVGGSTNLIPPGSIKTAQGLSNSGEARTSLTTSSNIGVIKQFTPNVVLPGQRSRLRITFFNPTEQPVTGLSVTDTLPAGVTVPAGANPSSTCAGATVSAPTAGSVQVAGGTIAAASGNVAASCYAEIDVLVSAQGDYVNTIPAGNVAGTSGGGAVSNSLPTSDTLRAKSPFTIHKAFGGRTLDTGNPVGMTTGTDSKAPGAPATMTIRFDNPNATALTALTVTDPLPAGLVVATTPAIGNTCGGVVTAVASGTSVRLAGGTIPGGGSCVVTVDVLSNVSGTYTNVIPASAATTGEGVTNAEPTSAQVIVSTPPSVAKQFAPAVIPPGGTSRLTIVIDNDNAAAMTLSAPFDDVLPTAPGQVSVAATPNVASTCGTVTANAGAASVRLANGSTIPAGGCTIMLDVTGVAPGVHTNNIPAGALKTSLGNNQEPANATLTVSTLGYVSGRVFKDNNVTQNGTFEVAVDAPLAGVTIELHNGASCAAPLVGGIANPVTTDALGNYLFSGLPAGTYSVCEPVPPAGTTNAIPRAGAITPIGGSGGTPGQASNPDAFKSQIVSIELGASGSNVSGSSGNNFPEIAPSSISGTVFMDQNNNGAQNGADTGIAGVTLNLLNSGGGIAATTVTDAAGNYSFGNLLPGTYSVSEPTQPPATSNGITTAGVVANGGSAGAATPVGTLPSRISNIVLPPNTTATGNNFAEIVNGRSISGQVFLDFDNSGAVNGNDHGIGGQTINLDGVDINGNPVSMSVVTTANGNYVFNGVPEGTYTVTQPVQPGGTGNGITSAGSTGGTASLPAVAPSRIVGVNLVGANMISANNNFAEVPGPAPDLAIAKTHAPVNFAQGSSTGYYTIAVTNIGGVATSGIVTVVDTLPPGMTPVAFPTTGAWSCAAAAQTVTCNSAAVIAGNGGAAAPITLRVAVAAGLAGQVLTNTAVVSGGNEPPDFNGNNTAVDPTAIAVAASLQGTIWRDIDHDRVRDPGEPLVKDWMVELLYNGVVVATTTSDANGAYAFASAAPGSGYQVRFREPVSGRIYGRPVPNEHGASFDNGVVGAGNPAGASNADGTLQKLTLLANTNTVEQSLPIDPSGVVYNAVTREPVAGAVVTISGPGLLPSHILGGSLTQTTGDDGYYQFLLVPGAPTGPGNVYTLTIAAPAGFLPGPSAIIPACAATLAVNPGPPDPALVQAVNAAPGTAVTLHNPAACPGTSGGLAGGASTTQYFYTFTFSGGAANVVNNHIPLDPLLGGAIVMTKSTPLVNVVRGDLVPYTVTATNTLSATLRDISVVDTIPPGFRYRTGTATLNGVTLDPVIAGRTLNWPNQSFTAGERKTWRMLLVVGTGVGEGEYVNRAVAMNTAVNSSVSNTASATVRVVPDPTFDCSDIIGKVFDDKNANGYQDQGEPGIANVRVATARGLLVTTDAEGRFHVACAAIPQMDRGSNFVMKLDERTLPSGYRITTENPRDVRVTRGKLVKLNFGATVHRVVRLDLAGDAFVDGGQALLPSHQAQLQKLPEQLLARPSVLRIAYVKGAESESLARQRLDAVAAAVRTLWQAQRERHPGEHPDAEDPINPLIIETELEQTR